MCIVSNITDNKTHEWRERYPWVRPNTMPFPGGPQPLTPSPFPPTYYPNQPTLPPQVQPLPTKEELDEFYRLLKLAKKWDEASGQPDCEEDAKRKTLQDMADQLGVEIQFPE